MERIDDLQISGFRLIQNTEQFCFGIDAVLLSGFAQAREGERCIDLCCGNGVISVLMAAKTRASYFEGVEIQEDAAALAWRNIELNKLDGRMHVTCADLADAPKIFGSSSFDVVTSNPPYIKAGGGVVNPNDPLAVSRHEILTTLSGVVHTASKLLRASGRLYMVHRPERLADIICAMRDEKLEPKRLRFVHPYAGRKPNMLLIESIKGASPGMRIEKPLILYENEGVYSQEMRENYGF